MPTSTPLRRRAIVAAAFAALVLVGCTGPTNAPTGYNDTVKANFVKTCTGDVGAIDNTTTTLSSTTYCECAYQVYVDNVPYDDNDKKTRDGGQKFASYDGDTFTQLETDLKSNPSDPPDGAKKALAVVNPKLAACPKAGPENVGTVPGSIPAAGPSAPGTTAGTVPGTTAPVGPLAPTTVS